jgi:glycopeptide antibiotics resistance protein
MKSWLKKLIIILPVIIVSLLYLRVLYHESYSHASFKRVAGLMLSAALLYTWVIYVALRRKQDSFFQVLILSSFFVYVFFVLQLTGYFILFKEVSSHGWWDKMNHRIDTHDHVNFTLFNTIDRYDTFDKQVAGNFIMLLPLGIYLPLLYKKLRKLSGIFAVLLISFLVSVGIEILQLATSYRSTDVDDIMLNTMGACLGFIIYQLIKKVVTSEGNPAK